MRMTLTAVDMAHALISMLSASPPKCASVMQAGKETTVLLVMLMFVEYS